MPLKNGYIQHGKVFKDGKFELLPVEPEGKYQSMTFRILSRSTKRETPLEGNQSRNHCPIYLFTVVE
jgi:hypothetical protein